jgi:hypothetical protein
MKSTRRLRFIQRTLFVAKASMALRTGDERCCVLQMEWYSAGGHLKSFRTSPDFSAFVALVRPYVKDIEEMRHYQLTSMTRRKTQGRSAAVVTNRIGNTN